jgi:tripartite-type tricarboxylate transporter receptor subunit TctC
MVVALGATGLVHAQTFPTAPVRIVVPFPPGGGTDILARLIARKMNESWGQPVIVDNRPGANGTLGAALVTKAPADGHTLLLVPSGFAVNPSVYPKLPYNSERDLAPVSHLASSPLLAVVHPSLPVKSIKELIALAKTRPGQINYGSSGNGSPPHLATEKFKLMAGIKIAHIPYKGGGPAMIDLLAGHIPIYFNAILQSLPYAKSGRLVPLAVTSAKRFPSVPEIPSIGETVPGYDMTNWYGMLTTGGTPREIVNKLQAEIMRILNQQEAKAKLAEDGALVIASTPDEFAAFLRKEIASNAEIVKAAKMTAGD